MSPVRNLRIQIFPCHVILLMQLIKLIYQGIFGKNSMGFPKSLLGLLGLLLSLQAGAAIGPEFTPVACPAVVLDDIPNANCAVRSNFSFLIFGSVPATTPSQACAIASTQLTESANIPTACQFISPLRSCVCTEQGGFETAWPVV